MAKVTDEKGLCGTDPVTGGVLETPEIQAAGLAQLRALMAAKPEINWMRTDDRFLVMFLRARKYRVQSAFNVMSSFNQFWFNPENAALIEGLTGENSSGFLKTRMVRPLSGRDNHGNLLCAIYMGGLDLDWSKINYTDQMRLCIYTLCQLVDDDQTQLHGVTYLESFHGFSLSAAMGARKYMDSNQQKKMMSLMTDTFPIRIRHIYVVDAPWYFKMFWTICKPFLNAKMVSKMHMLPGDATQWRKELHARVDPANLPPEFGGTLNESFDAALARVHAVERETGFLGGFKFPLTVKDPCGRQAAYTVEGGAASAAASGPTADL